METKLSVYETSTYLETVPGSGGLCTEDQALDLVASCWEGGTNRLMLHAENLDETFYQLRSGLAGGALQKFVNYRVRLALVIPTQLLDQHERFREAVVEANRGTQFRVFPTRDLAEQWLVED